MEYQLSGEEKRTFDELGEREAMNNLSFQLKIVYNPGLLTGDTIVSPATLLCHCGCLVLPLALVLFMATDN